MDKYFLRFILQFLIKYISIIFLLSVGINSAAALGVPDRDTVSSTKEEAFRFLQGIGGLQASAYWPGINPQLFLENLQDNISSPLHLYEGTNTNFCGYAALSYLVLHDDPLAYAKFMIQIFREGKAFFNRVSFRPSAGIRRTAGNLRFKGVLDIRPADQLWFLCLADRFKGYLNLLNLRYDPGDEDNFWAAVNFRKFNRMVKKMLHFTVSARGSDLFRPSIPDIYAYLSGSVQSGITVLYVNNSILHKKNYDLIRADVPTHYIILLAVNRTAEGLINIVYWDYGFRTLRQLPASLLKKIIFGVSHCTKTPDYAY
jgi:hypothetical protein